MAPTAGKVTRSTADHDRDDRKPKLFASVCAAEGGGKTRFGLTFPDPIEVFYNDPNTVEVVDIVQAERDAAGLDPLDVTLHEIKIPGPVFGGMGDIEKAAQKEWDRFMDLLYDRLIEPRNPPASAVFDTMTKFNLLHTFSRAGRAEKIAPRDRGNINNEFVAFLGNLKQAGCHMALLHRLKAVYGDDDKPIKGEYQRDGNSKTGFEVNLEVHLFHDPDYEMHDEGDDSDLVNEYGMRIVRCTARPALIGKEKWGVNPKTGESRVTFQQLARLVYPQQEW